MLSTETSQHALLNSTANTFIKPYLRATANSLDKVKRSLLLLGNMAAKMSVNRPEEGEEKQQRHQAADRPVKAVDIFIFWLNKHMASNTSPRPMFPFSSKPV